MGISSPNSRNSPALQRLLYVFWDKYGKGFWSTLIGKSLEEKIEIVNNIIDGWEYEDISHDSKKEMKKYFLDKVKIKEDFQRHYNSRPTYFNTDWSKNDWNAIVDLLKNGWDITLIQAKTGKPINVIREISDRYKFQNNLNL